MVARKPPPGHDFFIIRWVTPLLTPTFTSHFNLRLLETPLRPTLYTPLEKERERECGRERARAREGDTDT